MRGLRRGQLLQLRRGAYTNDTNNHDRPAPPAAGTPRGMSEAGRVAAAPAQPPGIRIEQVDHVGIRVTDRVRALEFYRLLGFRILHEVDFDAVIIIGNDARVEINLIVNGADLTAGRNILVDVPDKHPGLTHIALRVADMPATLAALAAHGIRITQGPVTFGDGHVSVFVRDPDRTVIELRARLAAGEAERIPGLVFYDPRG